MHFTVDEMFGLQRKSYELLFIHSTGCLFDFLLISSCSLSFTIIKGSLVKSSQPDLILDDKPRDEGLPSILESLLKRDSRHVTIYSTQYQ